MATDIIASPPEWMDDEDPSASTALGWRCNNRGTLDWVMSRIAALQAEADSIHAQKLAAIERIEKRATDLLARIERGLSFFTFHAGDYCHRERSLLLGGGKKKSADLLHGRIGWRATGGKLKVTDKDALLTWLEAQPVEDGLYRLRVEPEMKAIQDRFKADGVIPPGCEFVPAEDKFYVEPILPEGTLTKGTP